MGRPKVNATARDGRRLKIGYVGGQSTTLGDRVREKTGDTARKIQRTRMVSFKDLLDDLGRKFVQSAERVQQILPSTKRKGRDEGARALMGYPESGTGE